MKTIINEITPSDQAKSLGLVYGGFGGWIDPKTRVVKARTIDGKLVRVDDEEEQGGEENLGRLIILDVDDNLLFADPKKLKHSAEKYVQLIRALTRSGQPIVLMHARNAEERLAKFMQSIGVTNGATLVPVGSAGPDKKRELVEKKVKAGYSEIQFFDRDPKAIRAVESLKAPYNKRQISIETHQIPPVDPQDSEAPSAKAKVAEKTPQDYKQKLAKQKERRDPENIEKDDD